MLSTVPYLRRVKENSNLIYSDYLHHHITVSNKPFPHRIYTHTHAHTRAHTHTHTHTHTQTLKYDLSSSLHSTNKFPVKIVQSMTSSQYEMWKEKMLCGLFLQVLDCIIDKATHFSVHCPLKTRWRRITENVRPERDI